MLMALLFLTLDSCALVLSFSRRASIAPNVLHSPKKFTAATVSPKFNMPSITPSQHVNTMEIDTPVSDASLGALVASGIKNAEL